MLEAWQKICRANCSRRERSMKRFMFVIDGEGIECWYPINEKDREGKDHFGGFAGVGFYAMRARANWDRGCYYMEADITEDQEKTLEYLLNEEKDWRGGKKFVERITGRNFESETGYENPYDPDWKLDFGSEWVKNRIKWLNRAGLHDLAALEKKTADEFYKSKKQKEVS